MSIKSDKWIKEMAESHGMIEPFQYDQVKKNGKGSIVSFGTSSYGYDVRCSDEFKIFTNINSSFVDPKAFDEQSFVDLKSDVALFHQIRLPLHAPSNISESLERCLLCA